MKLRTINDVLELLVNVATLAAIALFVRFFCTQVANAREVLLPANRALDTAGNTPRAEGAAPTRASAQPITLRQVREVMK